MKYLALLLICCGLCSGQELLQKIDDRLYVESSNGWFRADLSGLFDFEAYYVDQLPPGLLFQDSSFINPRLSLFLDTRLGEHFYAFVQFRADRGFDPGVAVRDARFDEYFLRYTPFKEPWVNIQAGKFATVFGSWVKRHDSWHNPFITAPLPYENMLIVSDLTPAPLPAFWNRQRIPENKRTWLPLIWGPSYASGASVFGTVEQVDYAFEVKNASISSRPAFWKEIDEWDSATISGRIGHRPNAAWNYGISGSGGTYLVPPAKPLLPAGTTMSDYNQWTIGHDISYAHGHWQFWGEVFLSRFEVPYIGDADIGSYYLETKYKFTPKLYGALRWNQQLFGDVPTPSGGQPWDDDIWRMDVALGYRFTRNIQTKIQYSYMHEKGPLQQGEQLVAGQLTIKF